MKAVIGKMLALASTLVLALPGSAAAASASPASVNFGSVPINTTASRDITITVDAGFSTAIASGSGLNAPFSFDFSTCGAGGGFTGPGTCTVTEHFTPTSAAAANGTLTVFECPVAGGSCVPISIPVSGTGVSTAAANPPGVAFGNVPINTSVSQAVTITVDAGYRTEIASGSGLNAPFAFDFDTCGAGGGFTGPGTCTVTQHFAPTAAAASNGTTTVFECPVVGGSCLPIPYTVSGTGVVTAVANPPGVAFGNVPINTTVSQSVTLTVDAGYRAEIASGSGLNAPFSFDFSTCGAGGGFTGPGTCTVTQHFSPTAAVASNGTTTVFECPVIGGSCIPIPYTVNGTGGSVAAANPPSVDFGNVPINTTVTQSVTITVDAGYRTEIASGSGLNAPFSFDFDTCGAAGGFTGPGTCTVAQHFTPTAAAVSNGSTTVFECPVIGGSCLPIPYAVSGTGIVTAAANPASVAFGNVPINTMATQSVTITVDAGYRTEIASGSGLNAPFSFEFDACGAGGGFAGPGTCTVVQHFTPAAAATSNGSTTVFECPVIGGSCIPIPYTVSGTGVVTAVANPASVAFGNVSINTTAMRSVTITVDAGYRTEIASGSGLNAPFSFDFDTCGASGGFTGPGTCTVVQHFTPTAAATSNGSTTVFECPVVGGSCIPIPYTVSGTGVSTRGASPASVDFGSVPINTTVTQSVTITADAGYRVEIASGSGLNVPFSFDFDTCGAGGGFTGPGTCTVAQHFSPTAEVASNGTTTVFECPIVGGSCLGIPYDVTGTGISTRAASPAGVNFGNVPINTTVAQPVTITVDTGYRVEIASGSGINVPFGFDFSTCGAGGGFAGPGTCAVTQSFSPTAVALSTGTTTVFECPVIGGSCLGINIAVSGTGVSIRAANPVSVNFGDVPIGTTATQSVMITADAGYRIELASGSGINVPFSFAFDTCGAGGGFAGPGTCSVSQSFSPTAVGPAIGTTTVFECPVIGGSCLGIPYTVTGNGVSTRGASPANVDFGSVPINTTATHAVTITVDMGYRVELASGSGINVPFGFDFDTCGAGGGFTGPGTCAVAQHFTPTAEAASTGTTTVFECPVAGGSCLPIPYDVAGTGISTRAADPASVAFGNVPINTTASQLVTLTVDAGYRIEIASGSGINVPFGFAFDACGAGGGFAGPGTCTVQQSFTPAAVTASSGTTTIFECPVIGGSCLGINVSVSGTGVSVRAANPASVNFGNVTVGTTASQAVALTVDTGYRIELASGSGINVPFGFSFDACGAGGGFAGPGTCAVQQSFTPAAIGPASGTTTVFECPVAGGSCLGIDIAVGGSGVSARAANPASVNFGSVALNTTVTAPITLTVDAGFRISTTSGGGTSPFSLAFDTCGAGGGFTGPGTCSVNASFTPNALGPALGTVTAFECPVAGGGSCLAIDMALSGAGVSVRAASPASVSFGNVIAGSTATRPIAVTVDAGYRISLTAGGIASPFSLAFDTCGAGGGFAGPGTCNVNESFTPASAGPASGTLTVFECPVSGGGCLGIDVPSSGTGIAVLAITTASLPNGILGAPYPATVLQTSGGTPPVTWAIISGKLPRGLTLNPATGAISGTPMDARDHRHDEERREKCDGDGHDHWGRSRRERGRDDCDARDGTGVFTFTVRATDSGQPAHQTATATLTIRILAPADFSVAWAAPTPASAQAKKPVTFTLTVRNLGPEDGEAVVTDVVPAGSTFVSAGTSQGHCATPPEGSTGTVTCTLHTLEEGEHATVKITVQPTINTGTLTNTATVAVTGDAIDLAPGNNTATVTVQIK